MTDSLASLFGEAQRLALRRPTRRLPDPEAIDPRALWTNPENWREAGGVALIHAETQTLLGTFVEWRHKTVPDARRLVRAAAPLPILRTEAVEGDWWLRAPEAVEEPPAWSTRHVQTLATLHLSHLGVFAPLVEVWATVSHGSIARVELAAETQFAAEDGAPEGLLWLPKGTNVLPVMSQDSKLALRAELRL
jgi:hypothetical protein